MKHEIPDNRHLKRFEDYLLARGRKSSGRYLQVAQRFLEANPGEEAPFEAHHVNRFLANLSRGGAGGRSHSPYGGCLQLAKTTEHSGSNYYRQDAASTHDHPSAEI